MKKQYKISTIIAALILIIGFLIYMIPSSVFSPQATTWNSNQLYYNGSQALYVSEFGVLHGWGKGDPREHIRYPREPLFANLQYLSNVDSVYPSLYCSLFLTQDHTLRMSASTSDEGHKHYFASQFVMDDVVSAAAGEGHYLAAQTDGTAYFWEYGDQPKPIMEQIRAVYAVRDISIFIDIENNAYLMGSSYHTDTLEQITIDTPTLISSHIVEVALMNDNNYQLLTEDGTILQYSATDDVGTDPETWPVVATNVEHICNSGFLKTDGSFWHWLHDSNLQLVDHNVVNGQCNGSGIMVVNQNGTLALYQNERLIQAHHTQDFAPNRWYFLWFWPFKWWLSM